MIIQNTTQHDKKELFKLKIIENIHVDHIVTIMIAIVYMIFFSFLQNLLTFTCDTQFCMLCN